MIDANEIHDFLCQDYFAQHCGEFSNLFALSVEKKYCSEMFCRQLMTGNYAKELDSISVDNKLPCAREMLQRYQELYNTSVGEDFIDIEVMRWIGHIYCYWHLTEGESSFEIYNQADFFKMIEIYEGMHCIAEDLVIDNIKNKIYPSR